MPTTISPHHLPPPPSPNTHTHTHCLQPEPTVAVDVNIEEVNEAEFIPLETIAPSPPLEESSTPPMDSLKVSLISLSQATTSANKPQKTRRQRASNKPLIDVYGVNVS